MRFKIDENLPAEFASVLQTANHDAISVVDQGLGGADDARLAKVCEQEQRALVTLDLGFSDIRSYPPGDYPGIIVLRPSRQDRDHLLSLLNRMVSLLDQHTLQGKLWIVEDQRVRVRE